ncbi:acyltransferase domain-containing protein [Herbaspirillum sp. alder98]|uniref:acyltransferase domain-containing protein n=1 Tax=Herbaspirillum sp. alder98 TaxID=2913096 RepID=UPI001CD85D3E|nr:acyltransferase domain-containing protein [Herbaspirillum sp. alder98]MCA1326604.1 acyltransferase domain-containing protein [Herbaspirillum sp. alder98]
MSLRLAILCPGQGGQHPAMFDLLHGDARAADFLAQCQLDALLSAPRQQVLADPQALFANRNAQPLVVAAQLAAWQALAGPLRASIGAPALVAGYSVGELSAYAVAGVFAPLDTVALAARRARLMDEAVRDPQGLMSVGGLPLGRIMASLSRHDAHLAIVTGDDSVIVGGRQPALTALAAELSGSGAHCGELPVALASHTPLMQPAQQAFAALLDGMPPGVLETTLLAGVSGQAVSDPVQARTQLVRQLGEPIQWAACMDACAEHRIEVALELGPGNALSRMLRERHPQIACRSLSDFRSLDGVLAWLQRQAD